MAREVQWMICSYFPRLTWEQRRSAAWLALDPGRDCTLSFKRERNPEKILSHHLEAKLQIQSIETLGSSVIRHEKTKSYPRSTWLDAENHETTARMVKMCVKFWQPFIALWLDVVCLLAKCTYSIFIILNSGFSTKKESKEPSVWTPREINVAASCCYFALMGK